MPFYSTLCLVNARAQPKVLATLFKQSAQSVWSQGGIMRKVENLGVKATGEKIRGKAHGDYHNEVRYVYLHYDAAVPAMKSVEYDLNETPEVCCIFFFIRPISSTSISDSANYHV
jgi:hypothetical protein